MRRQPKPKSRKQSDSPSGRLEVGQVVRPHGLRGEVVVEPVTNRPERFSPGSVLFDGARRLVVERSRPHRRRWIVAFEGTEDRDGAEGLRGVVLTGDPIDVLTEEEVWVHELVGCSVVEVGGSCRGRVVAIEVNPASDLLVLDTGAVVPMVFVVATEPGRLTVDVPAGLFEEQGGPVGDRS